MIFSGQNRSLNKNLSDLSGPASKRLKWPTAEWRV